MIIFCNHSVCDTLTELHLGEVNVLADMIPRDFIELVLARVDIIDLINTHIPLRKKSGSNYFARCPFHQEKSASFSVSQPKQFYHCFGCGVHGNAIDFLMQHDHLSFPEAVEALARHVGMEVPREATTANKKEDYLPALFEVMTRVATHYYEQMCHTERAIDYLKRREITGQTAKQFGIGYAPDSFHHVLDRFGKNDIEKKHLLDAGLIIKKNEGGYYDRFRDRIMFPIHDYRGRIIGFGGRILDQGEPKYLNSPETPLFQKGRELYGLYHALKLNRKLDRVLLVEGYMDVIALFQHGITYAAATLGTATTAHHIQRLCRYTSDIIFCFDGDEAGRTAAWRALLVLLPLMSDALQVRFLFLPEGEDPDTLVRKEGQAAFEARIQSALPLSTFFFQTLSQQCDMTSMEGRARFASQSLHHIKELPTGILQTMLLDELAKRARVDISSIKQGIHPQTRSGPIPIGSSASQSEERKNKLPSSIRLALALLVQRPALAMLIQEALPPLQLPGYAFLQRLIEIIQAKPNMTTGTLLEYWREQKEERLIAKLAQWELMLPESGIENEFLGVIRQLTILGFSEEINRLLAKAAQEGLSDEEKLALSTWIAKKKAVGA